ncbi:MAG: 3'(2'),5'-bisphosphate nucleotidase CysQ [Alphaproteobacteria bacterium]
MTRDPSPALLDRIVALAKEAGAVILRYYEEGARVRTKADSSPVTEADDAAEAVILPELARLEPEIPVVSEEAVAAGAVPDVSGGRFFLVDPLDGTREFLSRNGEFTVNIALIEQGRPVLGVVHAPALGLTFAAYGHGTATRERPGETARIIHCRKPKDGLVVVASRSHGDRKALDAYLSGRKVESIVPSGSSIKFCLVAAGEADLYPRLGPTMEWDTAAGQAVLEAANGSVETLDGKPLRYGKPGFSNPHFVAKGAPR